MNHLGEKAAFVNLLNHITNHLHKVSGNHYEHIKIVAINIQGLLSEHKVL
jgi:hypothetical protein